MENNRPLIVAMADQCRAIIQNSEVSVLELPQALHPKHILWMCDRIEQHAEDWPETKLHRWIGFVQCGMVANRILDFEGAKRMFDEARTAYGANPDDQDLIDHIDPSNSFKFDVGGEG